ncbi:MAG TPA: zf-HC2 domain-containing protein [Edaphobacter sp.]|nr:zf-HC2 domain-containing protein [Edaphobacter sp.]
MADFNQFGSVKPSQGSDPQHCAQCEAMLLDALDGTLSATDQATFDLHMIGCPSCATMLAEAQRGAAWMEMLKSPRPEPPTNLLERILAETSGKAAAEAAAQAPKIVLGPTDRLRVQPPTTILGRPAIPTMAQPVFTSAKVIPFRTRVTNGFRSLGQTMLQPRLAMTAAMAFFSIALTLNLTGVRLSDLRASDFKPSSIMRSASQAKASVVRNFDNLRVVYELESRVRDLQRASDDNSPSTTPAPQNDPNAQQPGDPNQKSAPQKQNQKQTKPNPGSSRRETPSSVQLVLSVPPATPFATKHFVVFTPSVFKQEGGLV